jgi:hypothetical protein
VGHGWGGDQVATNRKKEGMNSHTNLNDLSDCFLHFSLSILQKYMLRKNLQNYISGAVGTAAGTYRHAPRQ